VYFVLKIQNTIVHTVFETCSESMLNSTGYKLVHLNNNKKKCTSEFSTRFNSNFD